jgi:hypothetical protein
MVIPDLNFTPTGEEQEEIITWEVDQNAGIITVQLSADSISFNT